MHEPAPLLAQTDSCPRVYMAQRQSLANALVRHSCLSWCNLRFALRLTMRVQCDAVMLPWWGNHANELLL